MTEDFAVRNDGTYPASTADAAPGVSIIDLLPQGQRLENPWTGARTEPTDGPAVNAGSTGYRPIQQNGVNVGYIIEGADRNVVVITLSNS